MISHKGVRNRFHLPAGKRFLTPFFTFVLAALPWFVLHHVLNYAIGGTVKPANANPEYFRWPGSPFAVGNLTGSWNPSQSRFLRALRRQHACRQTRVSWT